MQQLARASKTITLTLGAVFAERVNEYQPARVWPERSPGQGTLGHTHRISHTRVAFPAGAQTLKSVFSQIT